MPKAKVSKVSNEKVTKTKIAIVKTKKQIKEVSKKSTPKSAGLTVKVFDTAGKAAGSIALPKEIFGQVPNKSLLRQAVHIYFVNNSGHFGHAKTRAEVSGGGKKPWRQKGTGRARAGSIRSPLWVGGAKALGPRSRKVRLDLPKKMRRKALISSLSQKAQEGRIKVVSNLEKVQPKTKIIDNLLSKTETQKPALFIVSEKNGNLKLASRNIPQLSTNQVADINAWEIIRNKEIIFSKEALSKLS